VKQRCVSEQFIAINDNLENACQGFYINWKVRGREQDSGETERECVLVAEHRRKREMASELEKNIWCKCEIN
jgi:hypothetical protein